LLPVINKLIQSPGDFIPTLIIVPTRELAIQIDEALQGFAYFAPVSHIAIYGGTGGISFEQEKKALTQGANIIIATPGRLIAHFNMGYVKIDKLQHLILDEADRMLDMGFIADIRRIIPKLPPKRQTLFFSATMPPEIQKLADTILVDPVKVEVTPVSSTAENVEQHLYYVEKNNKPALLRHLLEQDHLTRVLVFTRTKHGADRIVKVLHQAHIHAEAIHGNKAQNARQRALSNFKDGKTPVLIATDIAARGIDVDEISHVINYDIPNIPETYVHRIGRTGRAGKGGTAISFCEVEERPWIRDIQKLIKQEIPVVENHPYISEIPILKSIPAQPVQRITKSRGGQARRQHQLFQRR